MKTLPRIAQAYVAGIWLLGVVAAGVVAFLPMQPFNWELLLLLALAVLSGDKKITLLRRAGSEDVSSMSVGFAIAFAALLRFGPTGGLLVGCANTLASCYRQKTFQLLFNIALSALEAALGGYVLVALNGGRLDLQLATSFPAVASASLTYFAINTFGVSFVIALVTGNSPRQIWRESFLWTAPSYFAGASIGALGMLLFHTKWLGIPLLLAPILYLTYHSYSVYSSRANEKQRHIEQLADLYLATIKSLALAIDAKDQYTHQHILRVQRYAVATAEKMGIAGNELEGIRTGALLHDIGKLGVPEYVLLKPGRLTDEEFAKIRRHPEIGAAILDPVEFPWPVLPVVKYHHERWDGTGYPEGLVGENIPITARILSVADVYDALTSSRSYRLAWDHEKAVAEIQRSAGIQFDPVVVEAFVAVIDDVVAEVRADGSLLTNLNEASSAVGSEKAQSAVRDIQRASSELWALYEVAQTLSASMGLQETLDILARKLEAILPGTACLFLLRDESDGLKARAIVGLNVGFFQECHTLSQDSRSLVVATSKQTYLGPYDADDLLLQGIADREWIPLRTALIVPIVHQGEVLGTINLYHPHEEAFGEHDHHLLEMIAERAALALYNGLLFDRTRSHANTDPMTGLYNVRFFTEHIGELCQRAQENPRAHFGLLCLDLDSFKPINDNFGHQRGDIVLKDLAELLLGQTRNGDIVARYGGDEFLIVLSDAGPEEAARLARRIQERVEHYDPGLVHPKLGALRLGASIGFACFPDDGRDGTALISVADSRMYKDKTERKLQRLVGAPGTSDSVKKAA